MPLDTTPRTITIPSQPTQHRSWLTYEHPFYAANKKKWEFAKDYYSGAVIDEAKITKYLIQRAVGEPKESYEERCKTANDYTNHYAQIIESLAGMLFAVEGDAIRVFSDKNGNGLGEPSDKKSLIGQLWGDADGEGHGYLTQFKQLAIELDITHMAWVFVDPANGTPRIRILEALSVPNWAPDYSEAVIVEESDTRGSIRDAPTMEKRYLHLSTTGWQRYRIDSNGQEIALDGPTDKGAWTFVSRSDSKPVPPIFPVQLVLKRPVGWLLAKKAQVIFNMESFRDWPLRTSSFPRLVLNAGNDLFDKITATLTQGGNILQEDPHGEGEGHRYIAPDHSPSSVTTEVLKQKVQDFHRTAHREYDDSVQQRTATEVRQEVASGTGAFLQLLKAALDDAENRVFHMIEQQQFSDRSKWGIAFVERSDNFMPADPDAVIQKTAELLFGTGKSVPLGKAAMKAAAMEAARQRGLEVNESEIEAAVEVRYIIDTMNEAVGAGLALPAEIRADAVMKLVAAAGIVDADAVMEMADGQKVNKLVYLRQKALEAAEAADEAKRRESEQLTGGGGNDDDDDPPEDPEE